MNPLYLSSFFSLSISTSSMSIIAAAYIAQATPTTIPPTNMMFPPSVLSSGVRPCLSGSFARTLQQSPHDCLSLTPVSTRRYFLSDKIVSFNSLSFT